MTIPWKTVGMRAAVTFIQSFIAVVLVTGVNHINSWNDAKPAVVAAIAALLSFVYNTLKEYTPPSKSV